MSWLRDGSQNISPAGEMRSRQMQNTAMVLKAGLEDMETGRESKQSICPSADLEAWKQITNSFSIILGCYLSCF